MPLGETFQKNSEKYNGIYRGKVLDNLDPLMYGRCKIQIYPMFSEIVITTDLPWVVPAMSLFVGAGDNTGSFNIPDINSFVFCFFEEGDIYQPVYFAEAQTAGKGLPVNRITNYPNRRIIRTKNGIEFYIDDTSKEIKLTHPTGTVITITTEGKINIDVVEDINMVSTKTINITGEIAVNINP
jgi:hypothetical protein